MELRPADLGDAYQAALVLRRAHLPGLAAASTGGRMSRSARRWTRKLGLKPDVQRETLPAAERYTRPLRLASGFWASVLVLGDALGSTTVEWHLIGFTAAAAGLYIFADALPATIARNLYVRPVSESDVAGLRAAAVAAQEAIAERTKTSRPSLVSRLPPSLRWLFGARTEEPATAASLETDYFDLIQASLRLTGADAEVQVELRTALRQIGSTVAAIRRSEVEEDRADARDLIGDAELLAARARTEPDRIVAASLLRQAQARVDQAKIVEKNALLRRRTRALSAELRAQIAAAQSSLRNLTSQGSMRAESSGAFRAIGKSVSNLAVEADSVMRAHEELSAALGETSTAENIVTAQAQAQSAEKNNGAVSPSRVLSTTEDATVILNRRRG